MNFKITIWYFFIKTFTILVPKLLYKKIPYLTIIASLYLGNIFNIKQASASSQWKQPSWVPIFTCSVIVTNFCDHVGV